jgi:hypothetical protein
MKRWATQCVISLVVVHVWQISSSRAESDDESSDDSDRGGNRVEEDVNAAKAKRNASGNNTFAKDRFFIDKLDTATTDGKTLYQGNFTSSTMFSSESGGALNGDATGVNVNSQYSRLFTDLRAQLDARHIKGGRWDFRFDGRGRVVSGGGTATSGIAGQPSARIQSGALGRNEFELRETWLVRSGDRTDVFIGRQFVTDLAATKIDGIRIDYAMSRKFTVLGYAGALPYRGSRSIGTDYPRQVDGLGAQLGRTPPIGAGLGAAYRTPVSYGALGLVLAVPLKGDSPKISVTSNGYYRGRTLDFYHFALVDLFKTFSLANVSAGGNYKPSPKMRLTAAFHRVDLDTLAIQARAFLSDPTQSGINEIALRSAATNHLRGGLSAGLGRNQRFEISLQGGFRFRSAVAVRDAGNNVVVSLPAERGAELYAGIVDRRSIAGLRLGFDATRFFGVGKAAFQRSSSLSLRLTLAKEFKQGRGQLELEAGYISAKDENVGADCKSNDITACFGSSLISITNANGNIYYRLKGNLFAVGTVALSLQGTQVTRNAMSLSDPTLVSKTVFLRLGYRY